MVDEKLYDEVFEEFVVADNGKIDGKLTTENLKKVPFVPPIMDMEIDLPGYQLKIFPYTRIKSFKNSCKVQKQKSLTKGSMRRLITNKIQNDMAHTPIKRTSGNYFDKRMSEYDDAGVMLIGELSDVEGKSSDHSFISKTSESSSVSK